jgi:hypothetical protein
MIKRKIIFSMALFLTTAAFLSAQTVDEIVSKVILASGGKDVIEKINTISVESITQVMGSESPTQTSIVNGKGYKNVSDMGDQKIIQCYTDKGGWTVNPMSGGGVQPVPPNQYKSGKLQFDIGGPLLNYQAKGNKLDLIGKEMVGQVEAYKLKIVTKDSAEFTYFIDPASFHLIQILQKTDMMGQEITMKINFSDFQKTEIGYVMPFAMDMAFGDQFSLTVLIKKVEFNKPIDPAIFEMPK